MADCKLMIIGIFILILGFPAFVGADKSCQNSSYPSALDVLSVFNSKNPGYGIDHYNTNEPVNYAMTYALYASAAAMAGKKKKALSAADWLVANAVKDNRYGWPFPFEYKTFGSKEENPQGTIYAPAQAFAVKALLDVYCVTHDQKYALSAKRALDYFKSFYTETKNGGYFWYSDKKSDAIEKANSNALLMGQYARAAHIWNSDEYRKIARETFENLWMNRYVNKFGAYWLFALNDRKKDNDLVHHAFVVQGLLNYVKFMDAKVNLSRSLKYFEGFFNDSGVTKWHRASYFGSGQPARLWGIGMLIYTLDEAGLDNKAKDVAATLSKYRISGHQFAMRPGGEQFFPRQQAFLALGLSRLKYGSIKLQCGVSSN